MKERQGRKIEHLFRLFIFSSSFTICFCVLPVKDQKQKLFSMQSHLQSVTCCTYIWDLKLRYITGYFTLRIFYSPSCWFKVKVFTSFLSSTQWPINLSQVCWRRETSKTSRTAAPEDRSWRSLVYTQGYLGLLDWRRLTICSKSRVSD